MAKKSKSTTTAPKIAAPPAPKAPWIYISDPSTNTPNAAALSALLDSPRQFQYITHSTPAHSAHGIDSVDEFLARLDKANKEKHQSKKVYLIVDLRGDDQKEAKLKMMGRVRDLATKSSRDFASVNLNNGSGKHDAKDWGSHHFSFDVGDHKPEELADKVYKWLCKSPCPSHSSTPPQTIPLT
jgi:hypothetical protein